MFCVFCGAGIAPGSASCPACKRAIPRPKAERPPQAPPKPSPPRVVGSTAERRLPPSLMEPQRESTVIGRTLVGRYRILEKIGSGSSSSVYRAEDGLLGGFAAVKVLSPERMRSVEGAARFQREAGVAIRISHPNAISTLDSGLTEDGLAYIAMEYVAGQPLSELVKSHAPQPLEWVISIAGQAAAALDAAHRLGIVHRDFKPDNVLVCRQPDGTDLVKVLDFGVAKQTVVDPQYQALTKTGFVVGTPQYMAPEQVKNEPVSARSDLYSLAVVVYELLTGGLPFAGHLPQHQMFNRLLEDPLPFSVVNPQLRLPPEVEMVVMKAMSRQSEERYGSTLEFASALAHAGRSGLARPKGSTSSLPPLPEQAAWYGPSPSGPAAQNTTAPAAQERRGVHPLIWIAVAAVVLGAIAVFGVFVYLAMR